MKNLNWIKLQIAFEQIDPSKLEGLETASYYLLKKCIASKDTEKLTGILDDIIQSSGYSAEFEPILNLARK